MRVTKVKGHASENMVEMGAAKMQDKKGNDKADKAAGRGTDMPACSGRARTEQAFPG